jgi:hypothetical protein
MKDKIQDLQVEKSDIKRNRNDLESSRRRGG